MAIRDKNIDKSNSNFARETVTLFHKAQIAADVTAGTYGAWIAPYAGTVVSVNGWLGAKGGSAASQLNVLKGTTEAAAVTILSAVMNMTSDAIVAGSLSATASAYAFAAGDALFLQATTGNTTTMDRVAVTITVRPKLQNE
jgi:hypothetical protein